METLKWYESLRYATKKEETLNWLRHATEQVEKDQHLNAQGAMTDALRSSQSCFGIICHDDSLHDLDAQRLDHLQDLLAASPMSPIVNKLADRLEPAHRQFLLLALLEAFEMGKKFAREQEA